MLRGNFSKGKNNPSHPKAIIKKEKKTTNKKNKCHGNKPKIASEDLEF